MIGAVAGLVIGSTGHLYLAGGGETSHELVRSFIRDCGGPGRARILVLPQVSQVGPNAGVGSKELLESQGAKHVVILSNEQPPEVRTANLKAALIGINGVWIPGGQQERFLNYFGHATAREILGEAWRRGVHFYGTSAGAMIMADTAIYGPGENGALVRTGQGLGFLPLVVDTHYAERKRQARLAEAMRIAKADGLGLSERDWVVFANGRMIRMVGTPARINALTAR